MNVWFWREDMVYMVFRVCKVEPVLSGRRILYIPIYLIYLYESLLQRLRHRFRFGVDMKLFIDVIDMGANGPDADIAVIPDHFIAVAVDQALQNGQFFRGKCIVIIG